MNIEFLTDEENETFVYLLSRTFRNRTPRFIEFRGSSWSVDTDALIYIDAEGCDTAWMEGAEITLEKHLTAEEINHINNNGYIVKDKNLFAFGTFLIEHFIKAAVLLKGADKRNETLNAAFKRLIDHINDDGTEVQGEIIAGQLGND